MHELDLLVNGPFDFEEGLDAMLRTLQSGISSKMLFFGFTGPQPDIHPW